MKNSRWWGIPLVSLGLVLGTTVMGLPAAGQTGDETAFLLQEHGGVRIMRGLDEGKNFESTVAPEDEVEEEAAVAAPAASSDESTTVRKSSGGIVTHRAGGTGAAQKRLTGSTRATTIRTHKVGVSTSKNITTHKAGGSSSSKIRTHKAGVSTSKNITTHKAGGS